ncbi:conserved Plasmodium protein, unknown function [Plasmodium gallinaceum]|uniref:Uncharacterized protein n=1 Tax=Plasmodium gallinaceum TaxID=5849 RepID=A0A1J1GPL8_PLAGA|nr:conserved Plasmodium protein, unknown function [Plasmodium gallinaceum]CRG94447.1 conserved Plasmodium protein, unknown function [Plasmodium gallinaceum]
MNYQIFFCILYFVNLILIYGKDIKGESISNLMKNIGEYDENEKNELNDKDITINEVIDNEKEGKEEVNKEKIIKENNEKNDEKKNINQSNDEKNDEKKNINQSNDEKNEENDDYFDVGVENLSLFPNPDELYNFLSTEKIGIGEDYLNNKMFKNLKGTLRNKKITKENFLELYKSALSNFDVDGYTFLMEKIMQKEYNERFTQKIKKLNESYAHCDKGIYEKNRQKKEKKKVDQNILYPGGPIRSTYGNNLSKWMKDSLENIETPESIKEPGLANMVMQSLTMVKGLIQSVASSVVDIVPPLIPPPVWINRPLPCLPMVTGKNCLGSILYPITAAEFITADITDSIMNGVISSFPSKYAVKIGKTSETQYRICAMAYLGMFCASIFPICWLPIGLKVAETMPMCFPQCLATLIACPGFWIDDIEGPCSNVSVPPFCSFSIFVNQKIVPPQLTSYDDSHSFPATCPTKDEQYDLPDDLYEHKKELDPLSKEIDNYSNVSLPTYPDLISNIHSTETKIEEIQSCKCMNIIDLCKTFFALPVVDNSEHIFKRKYETPVKLSKIQKKCCQKCKPIWKILYPKKKIINLKGSPVYPKSTKMFSDIIQH